MAKKSKVDVGKGFKRIFFVIAAAWVAIVFFFFFSDAMYCVYWKRTDDFICHEYSLARELGLALFQMLLVVPLYYFLRWLIAGFKK